MASKKGRSLGDIFTATAPAKGKSAIKGESVDNIYTDDDLVKASTYFTQDQLDYLDEQSREIRRHTKVTLKRTTILRGIVQGMMDAQANLGKCSSEKALAAAVEARMPLKGGLI